MTPAGGLRRPWWERWASLSERDYSGVSIRAVTSAIDIAAWFIENHAHDAEQNGWLPVHILRPGTGLAWRWKYLFDPDIRFADGFIRARINGLDFIYRASRDGYPELLFGSDRNIAEARFYA